MQFSNDNQEALRWRGAVNQLFKLIAITRIHNLNENTLFDGTKNSRDLIWDFDLNCIFHVAEVNGVAACLNVCVQPTNGRTRLRLGLLLPQPCASWHGQIAMKIFLPRAFLSILQALVSLMCCTLCRATTTMGEHFPLFATQKTAWESEWIDLTSMLECRRVNVCCGSKFERKRVKTAHVCDSWNCHASCVMRMRTGCHLR